MKKIIFMQILSIYTIFSADAFATETHITTCPENITCDYDSGICDTSKKWIIDGFNAQEIFQGLRTITLSRIQASKYIDGYQLWCTYNYTATSLIAIYTPIKKLEGSNWVTSGFGKLSANCSSMQNTNACAGK